MCAKTKKRSIGLLCAYLVNRDQFISFFCKKLDFLVKFNVIFCVFFIVPLRNGAATVVSRSIVYLKNHFAEKGDGKFINALWICSVQTYMQ